jgi:hypothetical protein
LVRGFSGKRSVLANPPYVKNEKAEHEARQERHVQRVEPDQGRLADLAASQQELLRGAADPGDVVQQVRRHAHRPEGELVPGQQVAGERKPQGEQEQDDPDVPVEFSPKVGACEEDPEGLFGPLESPPACCGL